MAFCMMVMSPSIYLRTYVDDEGFPPEDLVWLTVLMCHAGGFTACIQKGTGNGKFLWTVF